MHESELTLPPHSIDAEHSILGSLLQANDVYESVADIISADDFYRYDHRQIYRVIVRLIEAGKPADIITVNEALLHEARDVGGLAYLGAMVRNTPVVLNASRYATIVRDRRIARDLIAAAQRMTALAHAHGDIGDRLEEAQSLIANLHEGSINDEPVFLHDVLVKVIEEMDERFHLNEEIFGLPTGLVDIDCMTSGLQKGDLIIIAGRPSMGKSALGMQIAQKVAMDGVTALVFSLEMSGAAIAQRALANVGRVASDAIRTGKLGDDDWPKLTNAVGKLHNANLLIDQASAPTVAQMRAKARRAKRKYGLGLIVVDYIQLMSAEGDNRVEQVSSITRSLKLLAM